MLPLLPNTSTEPSTNTGIVFREGIMYDSGWSTAMAGAVALARGNAGNVRSCSIIRPLAPIRIPSSAARATPIQLQTSPRAAPQLRVRRGPARTDQRPPQRATAMNFGASSRRNAAGATGGGVPSLVQCCINALAVDAPPRAVHCLVRRLPEELVMDLLQRMVLTNTITDDRLATFFTHARLVLRLEGCTSIRNSVLRLIPLRCPQLRCLDLSNCAQVNNTVVRAVLHGCPSLQVLRLDGCRHITDAAFQPDYSPSLTLRACATLRTISFARCSQLTEDLVMYLVLTCRALTDINFSRCKRIPSEAIRQLLLTASDLQRLTLSFMDISDAAFLINPSDPSTSPRSVLPRSLRAIDLTQSRVTDRTIFALASQCRYLEEVKLSHCMEITDTGVEALISMCPRIRTLDLNNCGLVTDRGVSLLGSYGKQLEYVNLSWCMNMTDKGVVDLVQGCERLRQLKLVWCTQLTDVTMAAVMGTKPKAAQALTLHMSGCKAITSATLMGVRARGTVVVGL